MLYTWSRKSFTYLYNIFKNGSIPAGTNKRILEMSFTYTELIKMPFYPLMSYSLFVKNKFMSSISTVGNNFFNDSKS